MVALGFIGMLLVVRPGGSQFTWTVVYPIGAATTFACFRVVSSHLSRKENPITTKFLTAFVATIVLCVLVWMDQAETLPALAQVKFTYELATGRGHGDNGHARPGADAPGAQARAALRANAVFLLHCPDIEQVW